MTRTRFPRKILVILVAAAALLAACQPSFDSTIGVNLVNWERDIRNIPRLPRAGDLDAKAQAQAQTMANQRRIYHSNLSSGVSGPYSRLGEIVGVGSSMAEVHVAFMGSPGHRAHILDRRYSSIGVGEARGTDGKIYVAIVFKG